MKSKKDSRFYLFFLIVGILFIGGSIFSAGIYVGLNWEGPAPFSTPLIAERNINNIRGMWVWDFEQLSDPTQQEALLTFAAEKEINVLYIDVYSVLLESPDELRGFISQAKARGIDVEFLAGEPEWGLPANHFIPKGFLRDTLAFIESSTPEQRPIGIQFDITPYILDEWDPEAYLTLISELTRSAKREGLPISVTIPFWFDIDEYILEHNGVSQHLSTHIFGMADVVVIKDYRDFAIGDGGILFSIASEIEDAQQTGTKFIVGIETLCGDPGEPSLVTFCEEGEVVLNRELKIVQDELASHSSFAGVAVHQYQSYRELIPFNCPNGNRFEIVEPTQGFQTADRFMSVYGCGGIVDRPINIYVDTEEPFLQNSLITIESDGRWSADEIILAGQPLPYTHTIYAEMTINDTVRRSNEVDVIKVSNN